MKPALRLNNSRGENNHSGNKRLSKPFNADCPTCRREQAKHILKRAILICNNGVAPDDHDLLTDIQDELLTAHSLLHHAPSQRRPCPICTPLVLHILHPVIVLLLFLSAILPPFFLL